MTIFTSTQQSPGEPGYPERSGQSVEVVRPLVMGDDAEVDWESGPMFRIRFSDGVETTAWSEELSPMPAHPQMRAFQAIMSGRYYPQPSDVDDTPDLPHVVDVRYFPDAVAVYDDLHYGIRKWSIIMAYERKDS